MHITLWNDSNGKVEIRLRADAGAFDRTVRFDVPGGGLPSSPTNLRAAAERFLAEKGEVVERPFSKMESIDGWSTGYAWGERACRLSPGQAKHLLRVVLGALSAWETATWTRGMAEARREINASVRAETLRLIATL